MNGAHLHLLLNHIPVIGTAFALLLLAFGMWRKSDEIKKAAFWALALAAASSVAAYLTGEPAEDVIKGAGLSTALVEPHEEAAGAAFWASIVVGVGAVGGLFWFRGVKPVKPAAASAVLVGAVIVAALMAWAAFLGGKIRHTEFHSAPVASLQR